MGDFIENLFVIELRQAIFDAGDERVLHSQ
jgi:hypothetical protein